MRIGVMTPVRLLGEGVAISIASCDKSIVTDVVWDLSLLRDLAGRKPFLDAAIIDVTQAIDLDEIRDFHIVHPLLPLLALGLREHEADVVAHGRAGFVGYIRRSDGTAELYQKVRDAVAGRFSCSPEMAAGIMRALSRSAAAPRQPVFDLSGLTPREENVARLVARGLSNKEIARDLALSESTVKHHIHNIFGKMGLSRRSQMMRAVLDDPRNVAEARRLSA
nr:response regulator transcription factor [Bradyrhizobium sp. 2S1]MCK7665027.1 response regulator transcription factor [Bradyrhizobium sp. 2S1]